MTESQDEYWARRAQEHARLAAAAAHRAAISAHNTLARVYRERAEESKSAANG